MPEELTSKPAKISGIFALAMLVDCIKNNRSDLSKLNPLHFKTMLSTLGDHFSGSVCAENIESRKKTTEFTESFLVHKARFAKEYVGSNLFLTACTIYFAQKGIRHGMTSWKEYQTLKTSNDSSQLQQKLTQTLENLRAAQQRLLALQAIAQDHEACPTALGAAQEELRQERASFTTAQDTISELQRALDQHKAALEAAQKQIAESSATPPRLGAATRDTARSAAAGLGLKS